VIFARCRGKYDCSVGTTDDEVTAGDENGCEQRDEAGILMRQLNPYLETPLGREQALSGMAGLRPLGRRPKDEPRPGKLIRVTRWNSTSSSGLISILGGKWTTHRLMAEDTIDAVQREMGGSVTPSRTKQHALEGASGYHKGFSKEIGRKSILSPPMSQRISPENSAPQQ